MVLVGFTSALYPFDVMRCQVGAPAMQTKMMTRCQYQQIANAIVSTWSALSTKCDESECQQADWASCVVRMAGHDFMDYQEGSGGSDGCTSLEADDNKGLASCLYDGKMSMSLNQAYQPFCQTVSLADFLVIAGEALLMATRHNANNAEPLEFKSRFKFGRTTARECPQAGQRLPNPEGSCGEVDRVFLQNLKLDWRAAAALSGAHTLGRANPEHSGYSGWWTGSQHARKFDNSYFIAMLTRGYSPEKSVGGNAAKNQWRRSDGARSQSEQQIMLNTDLCLAHDNAKIAAETVAEQLSSADTDCCAWLEPTAVQAITSQHHPYCGAPEVPPNLIAQRALCCNNNPDANDCTDPTGNSGKAYIHVKEFAENEGAWLTVFMQAWKQVTENGFEDQLQELEQCDGDDGGQTGFMHFDCSAGEENWERGWSEMKRGFCCKNAGVGCERVFDCEAGKANWENGWSDDKKLYCCKQTGISCDDYFDCNAGLDKWQRGWSVLKQSFCCKSRGVACEAKFDDAVQVEGGQQTVTASTIPFGILGVLAGAVFGLMTMRAWIIYRPSPSQYTIDPEVDSD